MERQLHLDALADTILQNHSFDFKTFAEARETISMDGGAIQYAYDRLSLAIYSHSLTKEEYSYLTRKLRSVYPFRFTKEEQKQRTEYGVLWSFVSLNSELSEYSIQKETRPDFVLSGQQCIGIEVTEFTTQTDSVLATICNQNFGKGLSAEEIKNNAIKKHGRKAKKYYYHDLKGTVAIGAGVQDINHSKEIYADVIIKKHEKYKDMFLCYDSFIILCDARMTLGVTSEWDAQDVVESAKRKCNMNNCTICILYYDNLSCLHLAKFVI